MARSRADETREALIAAVIRLLDGRSVADVSVKQIAAEAGVNHGLVHRYFGSKDGLVREAVARTNAAVYRGAPAEGHTAWCHQLLRERPEIARILARCCLDGPLDVLALAAPPPEQLEEYVASTRRALTGLGLEGQIDAHVLNALGLATLLGWVVFRPLLDAGFALPPDADEHVARLAALVDLLEAPTSTAGSAVR
jgi:TetR/AcrR family transcriptional regulator, repressor for neighboring sulfatase